MLSFYLLFWSLLPCTMINSQSNLNNPLPSPQCSNKKQLSPDSDR
ncbi:hypothetical protein C789_1155 [Microcystis aeruginosa FACHB-905 = DIANCHI905]|uniref:Uncharacterized protein n=1 Tax=Microcystis aeruginosa PCC 7806SL TaxID=1903187 RepID=A0AB33BSN3_MICA7|nr:hypothetical protein BH695_3578 [Microcystis aeruginosa PCC 7806SL]ELS49052.1 hypothetical protein C789_1155 [Microcystis aeruginosa FACHB-905 = DIANCHI905]